MAFQQGNAPTTGQAQSVQTYLAQHPEMAQYIQSQGWNPQAMSAVQLTQALYNDGNPQDRATAEQSIQKSGMTVDGSGKVSFPEGLSTEVANVFKVAVPIFIAGAVTYGAASGGLSGGEEAYTAASTGPDTSTASASGLADVYTPSAAATTGDSAAAAARGNAGGAVPGASIDPETGAITDPTYATQPDVNAPGTGSNLGQNPTTAQKVANLLGQGGAAVSGALKSTGDTQLENAKLGLQANEANQSAGLQANQENITGTNDMENQLLQRSIQEQAQRSQASKDAYAASYANVPHTGPFGAAAAAPGYTPTYLNTINALGAQAQQTLSTPGQYSIDKLPAVPTYQNYTPSNVPVPSAIPAGQPGSTQQSTAQKIGQYVPTALALGSAIANWTA